MVRPRWGIIDLRPAHRATAGNCLAVPLHSFLAPLSLKPLFLPVRSSSARFSQETGKSRYPTGGGESRPTRLEASIVGCKRATRFRDCRRLAGEHCAEDGL